MYILIYHMLVFQTEQVKMNGIEQVLVYIYIGVRSVKGEEY